MLFLQRWDEIYRTSRNALGTAIIETFEKHRCDATLVHLINLDRNLPGMRRLTSFRD